MLEQYEPKIYAPIATNTNIPRDIRDRFADILNVKDYGAVGDGNTNDTQSFKNAKSAANTKNTVVYVPYGTYKITENIADNQSDISKNAHTFLTDGHVTITGGGSVNVLDLSKALTRENGGLSVDNINSNGPIYLNSNSKLDFREGNGLVRVTNEDDDKQYIDVKSKPNSPITVTSEGVDLDLESIAGDGLTSSGGKLKVNPDSTIGFTTDGKLKINGSYLPTSGGTMTGPINFKSSSFTSGNVGHFLTTDGNKFSVGVDNQWIDVGQGLGVSSYTGDTYTNDKTYIYAYNQYVGDALIDRRVAFIDEVLSLVSSVSSGSSSSSSSTTVSIDTAHNLIKLGDLKIYYLDERTPSLTLEEPLSCVPYLILGAQCTVHFALTGTGSDRAYEHAISIDASSTKAPGDLLYTGKDWADASTKIGTISLSPLSYYTGGGDNLTVTYEKYAGIVIGI